MLAGIVAFGLAATIAAGAYPADDIDHDDGIFVMEVREVLPPDYRTISDDSLRAMGHAVCDALAILPAPSKPAVIGAVESTFDSSQLNAPLGPNGAAFFVGAATATYCPEYNDDPMGSYLTAAGRTDLAWAQVRGAQKAPRFGGGGDG